MVMDASGIAALCAEATIGTLLYSQHVAAQSLKRDQPNRNHIMHVLCYDQATILEPYPTDPRGACCLIRGTIEDGRVGHIVCKYPPANYVITTYWPDTQPEKWSDNTYTTRSY